MPGQGDVGLDMAGVNRRVPAVGLVVVLLVTVVGAYLFIISDTLPIPAGTRFVGSEVENWLVHVDVPAQGSQLVGAWTAYDGWGFPLLAVVNGTVARPSNVLFRCPASTSWSEANGSINQWVGPGPHTLYWGNCFRASSIVITDAIRLA